MEMPEFRKWSLGVLGLDYNLKLTWVENALKQAFDQGVAFGSAKLPEQWWEHQDANTPEILPYNPKESK